MISARETLKNLLPEPKGEAWIIHVPPPKQSKGWLNANDRDHWARRKGLTSYWRKAAWEAAAKATIKGKPFEKVWVLALLNIGGVKRRRDICNFYPTVKACLDGLTDAGVWEDDNDMIVTGPDMRNGAGLWPVGISLVLVPVVPGE